MSIATQIAALQADKTAIRQAILNKGGTSASGNGFDDFATDIGTIPEGEGAIFSTFDSNIEVEHAYLSYRVQDNLGMFSTSRIKE